MRKRLTREESKTIDASRASGEVYYHPLRSRFEYDGKPLKGITSILRDLYWPHYVHPSNGDSNVSNRRGNRGVKGYVSVFSLHILHAVLSVAHPYTTKKK